MRHIDFQVKLWAKKVNKVQDWSKITEIFEHQKKYYSTRLNEIAKQERNLSNQKLVSYMTKVAMFKKIRRSRKFDQNLFEKYQELINSVDEVEDLAYLQLVDPMQRQESIQKAFL